MDNYEQNSPAITDLLNMLVHHQNNAYWRIRCSYADGQGQNYMEATIYEGASHTVKGLFVFSAETGKVRNLRYRGFRPQRYVHVVDLLLDLINFERYQLQEAV